ncbi:polysaccharide biosynthesis protein [Falsibacillus albus]|uniref:Polysaccharide biosynthesis protein n=1 Tax=Falsibacillus albus TaxID=2478915 RepID=A0A3L7K1Q3_9BACI|nr:nucleoside-diphosphate sugar epimerase/dehydratase [Falsibacillus albus]RLQ96284.1 polysaccharide biosynthesis protein [Falsibacillus albus]
MKYRQRLSFFLFLDSAIILSSLVSACLLIQGEPQNWNKDFSTILIVMLFCYSIYSFCFSLYKKAWEFAGIGELIVICKVIFYSTATSAVFLILTASTSSIRKIIITALLQFVLISGSRFLFRMHRDSKSTKKENLKRTLIIGAGSAGMMVVRQLLFNKETDLLPVGFIDDNVKKQHLHYLGIPVIGGISKIEDAVSRHRIDLIVIAIPSLSKRQLNNIFQECMKTKAKTQILPMLEDIVSGRVSVNQFRDVQVEDLLGRAQVHLDMASIAESITDKVVLVTGAGGSIGSEICRQIGKFHPAKLVLLGHGENSIYSIEMELREKYRETNIQFVPEIADLQDAKKMMQVMDQYQPDVVYHAAAHKHVPLMERSPEEAVKNNMIGTMNVANAASWHSVKTFVMISSDKAVNPTSVMGATKRLSEMIIQHMNQDSNTKFVVVRFGNVLGSRGSVIPLFKKQIQRGGPLTVTHPDMVRYFMTIPEASKLVIQAGVLANGGEVFVLDMGEPVKIIDLAKNLIKLSGHSVEEIGIKITGMRPGEKLFEELLKEGEEDNQQIYPKIYIGKSTHLYIEEIDEITAKYNEKSKDELRKWLIDLANNRPSEKPAVAASLY